jgi:hypothetical protein
MEPLQLMIHRIMKQTTEARLPGMMWNTGQNMNLILNGRNVMELPKMKNTPCLIIGAGPSLHRENHLQLLKESNWSFPIITCDRMLIPCLNKGIFPEYVGSVDGHIIISKFYNDPIVDEYSHWVKAVMPVTIHPETAKRFKGETYWFVPRMDDFQVDGWVSLTKSLSYMCMKSILVTGGNCGTFCWNLAFYLKCNPIILIGFDLSYDTMDYTKTVYYSALLRQCKGDVEKTKKMIKKQFNPVFKKHYLIDPVFETYRTFMMNYINAVQSETINCTEGGALFGGKVKCSTFKEILNQYASK